VLPEDIHHGVATWKGSGDCSAPAHRHLRGGRAAATSRTGACGVRIVGKAGVILKIVYKVCIVDLLISCAIFAS
jgi:hypothetical protein